MKNQERLWMIGLCNWDGVLYEVRVEAEWTVLRRWAKLRNAIISFVMSLRPSVQMKQLGSHWTDFNEIWYLSNFRKAVEQTQVSLKSDKNKGRCTWRPRDICHHISLSFSCNGKCFRRKTVWKIKTQILSYVYWNVHHLDSWVKRDRLDVTCFIISVSNAQHVSDVNTSILRSLRLICWVISWVVLIWFDVCWCYVVVWLGWCGIRMQAEALVSEPAYYVI